MKKEIDSLLSLLVLFGKNEGKEARVLLQEDILDADEVAQMLKVHPRTIKRLASQRAIRGFRVGGKWRFRRGVIDAYIKEQEEKGPEQDQEPEDS